MPLTQPFHGPALCGMHSSALCMLNIVEDDDSSYGGFEEWYTGTEGGLL